MVIGGIKLRKPSHLWAKLVLFSICGGILVLWTVFRLPCPIRCLTGIICPGCGMGRAWLAALRLDLFHAFRFHPLFWTVPVVILFLLYDCRVFRRNWLNTLVLVAILLGLLGCYVLRLIAFLKGELSL